jgi:hypothetical protein
MGFLPSLCIIHEFIFIFFREYIMIFSKSSPCVFYGNQKIHGEEGCVGGGGEAQDGGLSHTSISKCVVLQRSLFLPFHFLCSLTLFQNLNGTERPIVFTTLCVHFTFLFDALSFVIPQILLQSDGKPYIGLIEMIYSSACGGKFREAYTISVRWFFRWCDLPHNTDKPKQMYFGNCE